MNTLYIHVCLIQRYAGPQIFKIDKKYLKGLESRKIRFEKKNISNFTKKKL